MGCSPLNVRYQPTEGLRSYKQQETDRQGAHGSTTSQPGLVSFACRKDNVLIHSVPLFVNTPILKGKCYMFRVFFSSAFSELTLAIQFLSVSIEWLKSQ